MKKQAVKPKQGRRATCKAAVKGQHGSAQGPTTQEDVDRLMLDWIQEMTEGERQHLCNLFEAGIELLTDFSEKPLLVWCLRAADSSPQCQDVLKSSIGNDEGCV